MASRKVKTNIKNPKRVEEQRSRIVKAAIKLVIEKGFHETSVREISHAAGLTQGTLYNYIRQKGDILYLICDEVVTAYLGAVEKALARLPEGVSRIEAAIRAMIEEMYQQQDLILLIYRESHKLDRRALKAILIRMEQSFVVLERVLREAGEDTPLAVGNMRVAVNILSYFPTLLVMRRWDLDRHVPHAKVVDELVAFMLRGFGFESARAEKRGTRVPRMRALAAVKA
jgi:TetR/AcrR family transcriptional regulator, cholesterol catabolism regulator